jgi:hypothetical protein
LGWGFVAGKRIWLSIARGPVTVALSVRAVNTARGYFGRLGRRRIAHPFDARKWWR